MQQIRSIPVLNRIPGVRRNVKPVYVSHTPGVPRNYVAAALEAVREVTETAGVELPVNYFGAFSLGDGPYQSATWYAQQSWNRQRQQLDASRILQLSKGEPYQRREPHYDVWITGLDLWFGDDDPKNRFMFGLSQPGLGTIQSYRRMQGGQLPAEELLKYMVEHELVHVFGTPNDGRNHTEQIIGTHCTNDPCIMGQVNVPGRPSLHDAAVRRRREKVRFCGECADNLRTYFR